MLEKLRQIGDIFKLTQREYEATINALNIFFGAIIGVSLGNITEIPLQDYIMLLVVIATMVSSILMVTYTHRPLWNSLVLAVIFLAAWYAESDSSGQLIDFPDRVLPTLSVWAAMAIMTEFTDRTRDPEEN
ncbi:hypothetical protein [Sphingorhabdus sp. Alg231-15]|uniref:hypothetical protein n=1 Tax=Sphingorhabdus sp. Alg231-15 TaxID=1922222 RepID=UPI000D5523E8